VAYGNTQGLFHTEIDVFRQLLIADSLRGVDGTGIVKVSKTGFPTWIKLDNDPYALLSTIVSKKKAKDETSGCQMPQVNVLEFLSDIIEPRVWG
jgi:hypothetical protein